MIYIQDGVVIDSKQDIGSAIDKVAEEYDCSQFIVKLKSMQVDEEKEVE